MQESLTPPAASDSPEKESAAPEQTGAGEPVQPKPTRVRLNYFDYFRAFAIIVIVVGHSYWPWQQDTPYELTLGNLITGGTAMFVFISGFFFHHVFYPRYHYRKFLTKKAKAVFLPYLILSVLGFLVIVVALDESHRYLERQSGDLVHNVKLLIQYVWTGRILTAYWYIPFITIVFLMSPMFIRYIKLPAAWQGGILLAWMGVSMWVHRPLAQISPIHSVVYFVPFYMLGIVVSQHQTKVLEVIRNRTVLLGLIVLGIAAAQAFFVGQQGNYEKKSMLAYNGIDLMLLQKIALIFFALSLLSKIDHLELRWLKFIASCSFALFFIHPWVLFGLHYFDTTDYLEPMVPGGLIFPIKAVIVFGLSLVVSIAVKQALGKRSKYVIGW
ncbi:acyltransferase family protein [Algisphaera agarilytica]|uniref:Peptidoglycan/LPS O-acetylase OafA/YrhL n=1 Tax=Algisphaera agarilytica TaxID=1385975 RepID=A0A7X0LN60_9BACT|nr:acyltransferase [Algisphaera agarilytica]MBB6431688.1 peptidoglycan/LPS O-acetylase OafA/YrhL [Algisphaera agarilytica]